jgi:general secretion pathway protein G
MQMICMKRRFVTLIEMMIVMFLIALITGVVAYNYRGSLDEGKVFKTKTGIDKLETILNLEVAKNPSLIDHISSEWQNLVRSSPLVQNAEALMKDGWGNYYIVGTENGNIKIYSEKYNDYRNRHRTLLGDDIQNR